MVRRVMTRHGGDRKRRKEIVGGQAGYEKKKEWKQKIM